MSEEDRDNEFELNEVDGLDNDDLRSESGLGGQYDNKRALHNLMERKRRDSIKDSFKGLQDCIPSLKGDKTSRAQVLKKTGEYITHMQKKIVDHQDEIKSLKSENSQLENQIKALERAKATGNFVNTRSILDSDDIVAADNIDLFDLNKAEIIYDDTSSDTSDSNSAQGAVNTSGKTVTGKKCDVRVPAQGSGGHSVIAHNLDCFKQCSTKSSKCQQYSTGPVPAYC